MGTDPKLTPDLLADFRAECGELVDTLIEDLLGLEADPSRQELIRRIFRALHTVKGNAGFMGVAPMGELSHRAEDAVALLRSGERQVDQELIDSLLLVADSLRNQLEAMTGDGAETIDISGVLARLDTAARRPGAAEGAAGAAELPGDPAARAAAAADPSADLAP